MSKLQKKFATAIATGALLLNTALPAFADVTLEITGNGSDSYNKADVDVNQTTVVEQSNTANISNNVTANADTGKNDANRNTGGSVSIDTGDASTTVGITNEVNSNVAEVQCCEGDVDVLISGNGDNSTNKAYVDVNQDQGSGTFVDQSNYAKIDNDVDADSNTGKNDANRNTGGVVSIDTGDASVEVGIDNMINFNWADVDCGCLLDVLAKIAGNGDDSKNKIYADLEDFLGVYQDNSCKRHPFGDNLDLFGGRRHHDKPCLENDVDADADTGKNDVDRNTGDPGVDPSIETGNADTEVLIENSGNSNVFGEGTPDPELPDWPDWLGGGFSVNITLDLSALLALLGLA